MAFLTATKSINLLRDTCLHTGGRINKLSYFLSFIILLLDLDKEKIKKENNVINEKRVLLSAISRSDFYFFFHFLIQAIRFFNKLNFDLNPTYFC